MGICGSSSSSKRQYKYNPDSELIYPGETPYEDQTIQFVNDPHAVYSKRKSMNDYESEGLRSKRRESFLQHNRQNSYKDNGINLIKFSETTIYQNGAFLSAYSAQLRSPENQKQMLEISVELKDSLPNLVIEIKCVSTRIVVKIYPRWSNNDTKLSAKFEVTLSQLDDYEFVLLNDSTKSNENNLPSFSYC